MRKLVIVLLFNASNLYAQHFSETIALATDKIDYRYTDTVYVSGILLSPDAVQPKKLSNYCTVELINAKGETVKRQKVRCKNAVFQSRIPLNETGPQPILWFGHTHSLCAISKTCFAQ